MQHFDKPTICYVNAIESLRQLVSRLGDTDRTERLISSARAQQDQALFWLPTDKLLLTEHPIDGREFISALTGIDAEVAVIPAIGKEGSFDSSDIDTSALQQIRNYVGSSDVVAMYAHTNTTRFFALSDYLSKELGVTVVFPEASRLLELRDHLDRKSGLRRLFKDVCESGGICRIPEGVEAQSLEEAARCVVRLTSSGKKAIAKADRGEASIGLEVFDDTTPFEAAMNRLSRSPFYVGDIIVVEEFIEATSGQFPSIEVHIPSDGSSPIPLHICDMLFEGRTNLKGNVTSSELYNQRWSAPFIEAALRLATSIQAQGYVGHFGIDAVTDDANNIFLLDLNSRRTGSSHVHDFGVRFWGDDYVDNYSVGNYDFSCLGRPITSDALCELLADLIADPRTSSCGVVPAELSGLPSGHFGSVIFAPSRRELNQLILSVKSTIVNGQSRR